MAEIQVGSIVSLKHNKSPEMTVEEVNGDGTYTCIWHEADGKLQREKLKREVLFFEEPTLGSSNFFF